MRAALSSIAVALTLLLGGCSGASHVAVREDGCVVRRESEMALRRVRDLVLLPATLDGRAVQMKLDTGAEVSTISPGVAAEFALSQAANDRVLRGVGGDIRTGSVLADQFSIGDLPPRPAVFSLGTANMLPGLSPPVAGLLGADLLGGFDLDLDVPRLRAAFFTVQGCPHFTPWPEAASVPLARTDSGLAFVVVDVDGRAVRALLDTGAHKTFMTQRLAAALGISDEMLADDPASVSISISRAQIEMRQHRFERIGLGRFGWSDVSVDIADVPLPGVDMLLGADLLDRQPIWISAARGRLWLR